MKIDLSAVPVIRDLLDKLILDQHNLSELQDSLTEEFRVVSEGGTHVGHLTKQELVGLFQSRVDEGLKTLNSKYYIEFKNLDGSQPLPMKRPEPDTHPATDPDSLRDVGAQ